MIFVETLDDVIWLRKDVFKPKMIHFDAKNELQHKKMCQDRTNDLVWTKKQLSYDQNDIFFTNKMFLDPQNVGIYPSNYLL